MRRSLGRPPRPLLDALADSILADVTRWRFDETRPCDPEPTVECILRERSREWGRDNVLAAIKRLKTENLIQLKPGRDEIRIVVVNSTDAA